MHIIVTTDGSARPKNPGPMQIGCFLRTECGEPLGYISKRLGHGTNNSAEYQAAYHGILKAKHLGATEITLEVDSNLVASQLKGAYRVTKKHLQRIKALIEKALGDITLHVTWEKRNIGARPIADALSKGNVKLAERLIAEKYPAGSSGTLHYWENFPELDDLLNMGMEEEWNLLNDDEEEEENE